MAEAGYRTGVTSANPPDGTNVICTCKRLPWKKSSKHRAAASDRQTDIMKSFQPPKAVNCQGYVPTDRRTSMRMLTLAAPKDPGPLVNRLGVKMCSIGTINV